MSAKTPDEFDDSALKVSGRLGGGRLHQFKFEHEGVRFAAAFRRDVVLAVEEIAGTAQEIGVIERSFLLAERFSGPGMRRLRFVMGRTGGLSLLPRGRIRIV